MMRFYRSFLLFCLVIIIAEGYMIDQNNYFYINSSFNKQTASFSMCFHFEEPASIKFQSSLLTNNNGSVILAQFTDQTSIKFTPSFDAEYVGYNNYDSGEYWVGVKFPQKDNSKQDTFEKMKLTIKIGSRSYDYVLLSPLFKLMLNAFEVSPTNTLYRFQDWLLISFLYRQAEIDAYFFQRRNHDNYKLLESSDWGFKRQDTNVNFQRHKTKASKQITLEIRRKTSKELISLYAQNIPSNGFTLPEDRTTFNLDDLFSIAVSIGVKEADL